jgi:hypothetical protein
LRLATRAPRSSTLSPYPFENTSSLLDASRPINPPPAAFDRRFLHGSISKLLRAHGVRIGASPPHRQSQNGAVERNWNTAVEMGRAFLAESGLPKRYWFWAVREVTIRMNMLPVKAGLCTDDEGEFKDLTYAPTLLLSLDS